MSVANSFNKVSWSSTEYYTDVCYKSFMFIKSHNTSYTLKKPPLK